MPPRELFDRHAKRIFAAGDSLGFAPVMELSRYFSEAGSPNVISEAKALWEATAVQNLVRYRPAGTYFERFRVNGKRVWKSLGTTVFSVAKQRLPETIREHRAKRESVTAVAIGKMTVGNAAQVYLGKVRERFTETKVKGLS